MHLNQVGPKTSAPPPPPVQSVAIIYWDVSKVLMRLLKICNDLF
jgi:hypothetical protein